MDSILTTNAAGFSSSQLITPLLGIIGAILLAIISSYLTYYFTRKTRLDAEWRKDKLEYYNELLASISGFISGTEPDYAKALNRYSLIVNTISLVAPQQVINILNEFFIELKKLGPDTPVENARDLLTKLIIEIRKDLKIKPKDDTDTFKYMVIGIKESKSGKFGKFFIFNVFF